jgi:nicotinamidase-related amidase
MKKILLKVKEIIKVLSYVGDEYKPPQKLKKALIVMNMQEAYVGAERCVEQFPFDAELLLNKINEKIEFHKKFSDYVIYIQNNESSDDTKFAEGLLLVSDLMFVMREDNCFSTEGLVEFLKKNDVLSLEIVGINVNDSILNSAKSGIYKGFYLRIEQSYIGIKDVELFNEFVSKHLKMWMSI